MKEEGSEGRREGEQERYSNRGGRDKVIRKMARREE